MLQLEGVEHFRPETLKDLVRTCILLKRHVRHAGLHKALRFSLCLGASTEAGVNFVIRPWRSSLLLRTFWKAKPTEILASVERPLISEPMHPLMISSESASALRRIFLGQCYSISSYLSGLRLSLLLHLTEYTTDAVRGRIGTVAFEAKTFVLNTHRELENDSRFRDRVVEQCSILPSVADTLASSSSSVDLNFETLCVFRQNLFEYIDLRRAAIKCFFEIMRLTEEVGVNSTSFFLGSLNDIPRLYHTHARAHTHTHTHTQVRAVCLLLKCRPCRSALVIANPPLGHGWIVNGRLR